MKILRDKRHSYHLLRGALTGLVVMAAVALPSESTAQTVALQPTPQHISWGGKAFDRPMEVALKAPKTLDEATTGLIESRFAVNPKARVRLTVGRRGDSTVRGVESLIPDRAEGYYLSVTPKGITVAGNDDAGLYYGLQSLAEILAQPEVYAVEVTDWPSIATRGVIEGFYGNPWSHRDRLRQFDFYGRNKMNTYIYGPKDDVYHHSRWYEPYPQEQAERMKELVARATANKVKFVWAMHPSNSIVSADDRAAALAKLEQMYSLGVRAFAIFFDDISAKSVNDQIDYLNFVTDEFVNKHPGVDPLIVCPTQYNRLWSGGDYLPSMGSGLYPDIRIMWTGNSVCDMIDLEDCRWFEGQTGRKPFIWLNYPVNDYGLHHLLMGPATGNGADIAEAVSAFCSNPMQYAEASMVALYGLADYSWNPEHFDAEAAWRRMVAELAPGHEQAFATFCINNTDVGPSVHGLRFLGESPAFVAARAAHPMLDAAGTEALRGEFADMTYAALDLLGAKDTIPELVGEIEEFLQYFALQGLRGLRVMDMADALAGGDNTRFVVAFSDYDNLTTQAEGLVSRGFEGSIQSVAPRTATLHVEPFIRQTADSLVAAFKASGATYPQGVFPEHLLANGIYTIRVGSRWLTDSIDSQAPSLAAAVDEINPGRQQWIVTYEPTTGGYSIVNEWTKRRLNHRGGFNAADAPYDRQWQSFDLSVDSATGLYDMKNPAQSGAQHWIEQESTVRPRGASATDPSFYIFEIERVN